MKKVRWFVLVMAAASSISTAPSSAQSLGIRGGVNRAVIGGDDIEDLQPRTGLNIGATLTVPVRRRLALQLGAGLSEKGFRLDDVFGTEGELRLRYVEIPALLQFTASPDRAVSPRIGVGPAFSFRLSCEEQTTGSDGETAWRDCGGAAGADLASFDLGLMLGAGAIISTGSAVSFTLDVLYDNGLTTIDGSDPEPVDLKNRTWSFLAGLSFPVGG